MKQIGIKLDDKNYAKIQNAAVSANKQLATYCRDLLLEKNEATAIDKSEIDAKIANIENQIKALNALVYTTMKQTYTMIAEVAEMSQVATILYHQHVFDNREELNFIFQNAQSSVKEKFENLFAESYEDNKLFLKDEQDIEEVFDKYRDYYAENEANARE